MNRTAHQLPVPDIVRGRPSLDPRLGQARGHVVARPLFSVRPDAATVAQPRHDLRVAGCFLAEVAFAHARLGEERLDFGQKFGMMDVAHA